MTTEQFNQIYTLLNKFANDMNERFSEIDIRLDKIENRLDKIEDRLDKVDARLDSIEATQSEHTKLFQEIFIRLDKLEERVGSLEKHTNGLEDDIKYLYRLIEDYKKDQTKGKLSSKELTSRLEEVEAIARMLSIKVGLSDTKH